MTNNRSPIRRLSRLQLFALISLGVLIVLGAVTFIVRQPHRTFALADKAISKTELQFCSPYANICFNRPANWSRSNILHVNGTKADTVEINPPTGTILEFTKASTDTRAFCDHAVYKECAIQVTNLRTLKHGLYAVTGMLIFSPDANCRTQCVTPKYLPFVGLVSQDVISAYNLQKDSAAFETFDPVLRVAGGQKAYLQITPGKAFGIDAANTWLASSEAMAAERVVSSVTLYR